MIFRFGLVVGIIGLICAILVIYNVFAKQKKMKLSHKVFWTIVAILFNIVTAIVYYFVIYKKKKK
jgi:hypothetical protein